MTLMDTLQNGLDRVLPQRKSSAMVSSSTPAGIGNGHGVVRYEDDMIISKPAIIFHSSQILFNFLAMACFASVASFQAKWGVGPSGLSGFALFVSVSGIFLSLFMLFVPVVYEKYDKFVKLAGALKEVRVGCILTGTGCVFSLLIAFVTTISAWTEPGCKNANNDPHASISKDFVAGLPGWCSTKKAGCIFFWLAFGFWLASLVLLIIDWRSGNLTQRPQDSPFVRPDVEQFAQVEDETEDHTPSFTSDETRNAVNSPSSHIPGMPFASTTAAPSAYADSAYRNSGYSGHSNPPAAASRASLDAYGAFSDPAPTGFGGVSSSFSPPTTSDSNPPRISRTMQYADPYAAVRASLVDPGTSGAPPSYAQYTNY